MSTSDVAAARTPTALAPPSPLAHAGESPPPSLVIWQAVRLEKSVVFAVEDAVGDAVGYAVMGAVAGAIREPTDRLLSDAVFDAVRVAVRGPQEPTP